MTVSGEILTSTAEYNIVPFTTNQPGRQYSYLRPEIVPREHTTETNPFVFFEEHRSELMGDPGVSAEQVVFGLQYRADQMLSDRQIVSMLGLAREEIARRDNSRLVSTAEKIQAIWGVTIVEDPSPAPKLSAAEHARLAGVDDIAQCRSQLATIPPTDRPKLEPAYAATITHNVSEQGEL